MSFIFKIIPLVNLGIPVAICQVDLGSFSLGQNKHGDLKFIFNQAANIFGFGGDRGFDLTIGEGRFNTKARQGALIAEERIGADSGININEAEGMNIRNFLSFGNNSNSSNNSASPFLSFLEKIKKFFIAITNKPTDSIRSSMQYENSNVKTGSAFRSFETLEQRKISGEVMNFRQPENDNYDDYYHHIEVGDEVTQRAFKTTSESSNQKNRTTLNQSTVETEFNVTTI
ncbi:hypothetical protein ACH3XW_23795 [Acanthocheilonema viteae]